MSHYPTTEEMVKGIDALQEVLKGLQRLQKDAIYFIADKDLIKEFLEYHFNKELERRNNESR